MPIGASPQNFWQVPRWFVEVNPWWKAKRLPMLFSPSQLSWLVHLFTIVRLLLACVVFRKSLKWRLHKTVASRLKTTNSIVTRLLVVLELVRSMWKDILGLYMIKAENRELPFFWQLMAKWLMSPNWCLRAKDARTYVGWMSGSSLW